jgi:hypothetical protein
VRTADVPSVQARGQEDQRRLDGRQVTGEPARRTEVGDRCLLRAEMLGHVSERAAEAVTGKNQGFGRDHASPDGGGKFLA